METGVAVLWDSEVEEGRDRPFEIEGLNETYRYFSDQVRAAGSDLYVAKYSWYNDSNLEKAYKYEDGSWVKVENVKVEAVFDKYRWDDTTIKMKKKVQRSHPVVNRLEMERLCKDKLESFSKFPDMVAETMVASSETVENVLETGKAVIKPRYDFGGNGVRIIDSATEFEEGESLLVQRFVDSSFGIPQLGVKGVHDLRVVVVAGEPVCAYVRTPDSGLISNVSMGGSMENVELDDVPEPAMNIVDEVDSRLETFEERVYSVDMVFDESGKPWVLELNSKPGLNFYGDESVEKWKKPVVDRIAELLTSL